MGDPKLFETDGKTEPINPYDGDAVWDRMMRTPGMQFGFQIKRQNFDPERSFSKDALVALRDQIGLYIGSRMMRHSPFGKWSKKNPAPQKMQVTVIVSIDGEPVQPDDTVPYVEWEDGLEDEGQHRQKGAIFL